MLFFKKTKNKKSAVTFSQFFINSDCFNLGIDPGDAFLIFDVHKYVPVITLVQCFITNTIVLVGKPPLYKEGGVNLKPFLKKWDQVFLIKMDALEK